MADFSLDQIVNFLAVVDHGSFSKAALAQNCAQSAVSFSVQKLEQTLGVALFDRSGYRPVLTANGRILLPQARRIVEDVSAFQLQAQGVAGEVEQTLVIVMDTLFPAHWLSAALVALRSRYPSVQVRCISRLLDDGMRLLVEGAVNLAVLTLYVNTPPVLERLPLTSTRLFLVAAKSHPLAAVGGLLSPALLSQQLQLVLTDKSGLAGAADYGVYSADIWRFERPAEMLALLLRGVGYAIMPEHLVTESLENGDLVKLEPEHWEGQGDYLPLPVHAVWRRDKPLGPAGQWFLRELARSLS